MSLLHRVALLLDGARGWDSGVMRGIANYANRHRPWQVLRPAITYYQRFSGLAEVSVQSLLKHRPDGVIMHESEMTRHLMRSGVPTIVVPTGTLKPDGFYISCDNQGVGAMAAEHLMGQGLGHFGFVGFADVRWSDLRLEAFRSSLAERGHEVHVHLVPLAPSDAEQPRLHRSLTRWLRELPKPTGVFVGNDDLARAVAELCQLNDINIPDDLALMGVDNDELICELSDPPLSSIPFATERAGYDAAEMLDLLMEGHAPETRCIEAAALPAVVRRSTDRLAIEDPDVLKALQFIRDNASRIIQVGDVVKATALSQRTLHNRFKAALGHSLVKEINRQRAQYIAGLLIDTNQTISRIAWKLGYRDDAHLVRFFRREMGESPGAYRRRLT
ncbi:substrate-binding domain-containing protein [Aeoliella sp.]|uniref:XylR family transcriptional regulator n=1 Tax=Aeoliella sp. TaxID=2795800 RepID=UPI003CCBF465